MLGLLDIGPWELLFVAIGAILLFGGDLPDVARRAGRTLGRLRGMASDLTRSANLPPDVHQLPRGTPQLPKEVRRLPEDVKEIADEIQRPPDTTSDTESAGDTQEQPPPRPDS